ncbi:lysoplasmalogenase family protein [Sphingomonas canadensis]|uniref:Lysoplasmalogenase family protein n=1 Tax=Sphingomonas canadensis TaxID=1219257 RepID=A0ABW3HA13_9SPHN|nr:lysoplasmalogenase [Sphingomonas canadensis]MCW3836867.1 lysoplasmalogenase [Sphingomonas canadensis]
MRTKPIDLIFLAAIAMAVVFFISARSGAPHDAMLVTQKGACVGLLAIWALLRAPRTLSGRLIVLVLALGAAGDILLETHGLTTGALAFLGGHIAAVVLYLRNRGGGELIVAGLVALGVAVVAWLAPYDRSAAPGIALYAAGLGAMAGTALISRFPRMLVGLGALLFVLSDLLIFWRMGWLMKSPVPGMLIWPTYAGGQALIAWGVVTTLVREREG